jgi:hypothetical protein
VLGRVDVGVKPGPLAAGDPSAPATGLGWTGRVRGHIARASGDLETALAESADALAILTSIQARFEAARTQLERAGSWHRRAGTSLGRPPG